MTSQASLASQLRLSSSSASPVPGESTQRQSTSNTPETVDVLDQANDAWILRHIDRVTDSFSCLSKWPRRIPYLGTKRASTAQRRWLVPSIDDYLVESILDGVNGLTSRDLLRNAKIVVTWVPYADGIGDLLVAVKIAKILHLKTQLTAGIPPFFRGEIRDLFSFLDDKNIFDFSSETGAQAHIRNADLVINVSGCNHSGPLFSLDGCSPVRQLNVYEYDGFDFAGPDPRQLVTGFAPGRSGFFVDQELKDLTLRLTPAQYTTVQTDLDQVLNHRLLGGEEASTWRSEHTMHLCYPRYAATAQEMAAIIKRSADFHGDDPRHLTLLVVTKKQLSKDILDHLSVPDSFLRLSISLAEKEKNFFRSPPIPEGSHFSKRRLHVVVSERLGHTHFRSAILLSDFLQVTGDQSLSEALSAGKTFFYDSPMHKAEMTIALERTKYLSPAALAVLSGKTKGAVIDKQEVQAEIARWADNLCLHHDIGKHFVGRVARVLRDDEDGPEVTALRHACEEAAIDVTPNLRLAVQELIEKYGSTSRPSPKPPSRGPAFPR